MNLSKGLDEDTTGSFQKFVGNEQKSCASKQVNRRAVSPAVKAAWICYNLVAHGRKING